MFLQTKAGAQRGYAATRLGDGPKAKAKRPSMASLAQDMKSMLETLPKFSAELGRLSERQQAMELRLPVSGKLPPLPLIQFFESLQFILQ